MFISVLPFGDLRYKCAPNYTRRDTVLPVTKPSFPQPKLHMGSDKNLAALTNKEVCRLYAQPAVIDTACIYYVPPEIRMGPWGITSSPCDSDSVSIVHPEFEL